VKLESLVPLLLQAKETSQYLFVTYKQVQRVCDVCDRWVGIVVVRQDIIAHHLQSSFVELQ